MWSRMLYFPVPFEILLGAWEAMVLILDLLQCMHIWPIKIDVKTFVTTSEYAVLRYQNHYVDVYESSICHGCMPAL